MYLADIVVPKMGEKFIRFNFIGRQSVNDYYNYYIMHIILHSRKIHSMHFIQLGERVLIYFPQFVVTLKGNKLK